MDWLELLITVPVDRLEEAEAIANMSVPYGIYIEDYSDLEEGALEIAHIDLIDEELIKRDRTKALIHIYFGEDENLVEAKSYLEERFRGVDMDFQIDTGSISEESWRDNWKKYFKVTEVGEKLVIRPGWEEYTDNGSGRKVITIDPGAAFGTGTHATTRLCLELLEKHMSGGTVLDIGTGSGILGIGAALLGAERVIGVDIDETAVKVARENALINHTEGITEFIVGDLTDKISGKFNIVCANIVADIIIGLSKTVKEFLEQDAVFLCSGIIDMRAEEVEKALIDNDYQIIDHFIRDNWHAFAVRLKLN